MRSWSRSIGKTRDGRSIMVRNFGFLPYFHVLSPRPELLARLKRNRGRVDIKELDLYYKGKLRTAAQVTVKYPWSVPSFRDDIKRQRFEVLAADIPFHHRFIYDKDMSSCIRAFGNTGQEEIHHRSGVGHGPFREDRSLHPGPEDTVLRPGELDHRREHPHHLLLHPGQGPGSATER